MSDPKEPKATPACMACLEGVCRDPRCRYDHLPEAQRAYDRLIAAGHEPPPFWDGRLGRDMTSEEARQYREFLVRMGDEMRRENPWGPQLLISLLGRILPEEPKP